MATRTETATKRRSKVPQLNIRMPKMTMPQWEVLLAAVEYHEAEAKLDKGFPNATCSGPERYWLAQRLKAKEALLKACAHLKQSEKEWRPIA